MVILELSTAIESRRMAHEQIQLTGAFRNASDGVALFVRVSDRLRRADTVEINCSGVHRVTPSFANAFVMNLLAEFPVEVLRQRCPITGCAQHVEYAFRKSVDRYQRGIRLSTQRSGAA